SRTVEPIPTTDAITIAGDPRLQMGDTIEIKDPEGMGETLRVQILGISRTFSRDGGLEDVLTVELVRPSGVGIWDSEQYGISDDTFIWSQRMAEFQDNMVPAKEGGIASSAEYNKVVSNVRVVHQVNQDQDAWMTAHLDGVSQADASHATLN